jgi:hypothetical protein
MLIKTQFKLQRGFTEKTSSLNTAFIVSQTSEHYKDLLEELILIRETIKAVFSEDVFSVNPLCNLNCVFISIRSILSLIMPSTTVEKVLVTVIPR